MTDILKIISDIESMTPPSKVDLSPVPPGVRPPDASAYYSQMFSASAPGDSADLERVINIPRRQVTDADKEAMAELMTSRLRRTDDQDCRCAQLKPHLENPCILKLKPAQGWALYEAGLTGGLFGSIGVGGGKTGLDLLIPMAVRDVRTAVLMLRPGDREQLKFDWLHWAQHWRVPSIVFGGGKKKWHKASPTGETPIIQVVAYSRLSQPASTVLLEQLKPDLIVADEIQNIANPDAARTKRFLGHFARYPGTRFSGWSGSIGIRVTEYAHLLLLALRENSPLPTDPEVLAQWAQAIDPPPKGKPIAPMGALSQLCQPGEALTEAYRRRFTETRGVIATEECDVTAEIVMHERDPGEIPHEVQAAIEGVRASAMTPEGDPLESAFEIARVARELAFGFHYYHTFPHGEPEALIKEWRAARGAYFPEVRDFLAERSAPWLDSPGNLDAAAERHHHPKPEDPPNRPSWPSLHWPRWRRVKGRVRPVSVPYWIDEYLVQDAAAWMKEHTGVVWCEHTAFAKALAEASGAPLYLGGVKAKRALRREDGSRSIICSIAAHGTGFDGLQALYFKQLIANPPVSIDNGGAKLWEQLLGRLHRQGQCADRIETWIYRHTQELIESWDRAIEMAEHVIATTGADQKILSCQTTW